MTTLTMAPAATANPLSDLRDDAYSHCRKAIWDPAPCDTLYIDGDCDGLADISCNHGDKNCIAWYPGFCQEASIGRGLPRPR